MEEWPERSTSLVTNIRRLEWNLQKTIYGKTGNYEKLFFVDKGKCNVSGLDGRNYVWRKAGEELGSKKLRPAVKYVGGGVMV
jgi:hypothetical protein